MRSKNLIYSLIFSLVAFTFSLDALSQTQSTTRTTYLENVINIERQIVAFETKIAWVVNNPAEDSIAKAEGWYDKMNNNLNNFKDQIVVFQIEQIKNYYNEILIFPMTEAEIQNSVIPEMNQKRKELAADYPIVEEFIPESDETIAVLSAWISEFPLQYESFTSYLETLVNNQNH